MNRFVAFLFLLGSIGFTSAAEVPPPPSPPYLATLPTLAKWRMNFNPAGNQKKAAPDVAPKTTSSGPRTLSDITITKSLPIRKIGERWSDGSENERWLYQGIQMELPPDSQTVRVLIIEALPDPTSLSSSDYRESDFPELSWINAETFKSYAERNGVKCLYFESNFTSSSSANLKKAWIAQGSKLPLAFDDGGSLRVYEFLPAPPSPLTLPAQFAEQLTRMREAVKAQQKHRMKF